MIKYHCFRDLLRAQFCDALIRLAKPRMQPATGIDAKSGQTLPGGDYRKSSMAFFTRGETPEIAWLERRIAALTNTSVNQGEGFQVLNYQVGGEYKPHYDYFDSGALNVHGQAGGQRIITCILYLNDDFSGGETYFPKEKLRVPPVKGQGLIFWNVAIDGKEDPDTLHAGLPVTGGEKFIATKWIREREF